MPGIGLIKQLIRRTIIDYASVVATGSLGQSGGRLSVNTDPVGEGSGSATIHFRAFRGSHIAVYNGSSEWSYLDIGAGISLAVASFPAGGAPNTVYDIYVYDSGGTPTLEATAWATATTRATAIVLQDGVWVRSGATTRRLVGSVRLDATTQLNDDDENRTVWNASNRIPRRLMRLEATGSWSYATSAWRAANGSNANRVNVLVGLPIELVRVTARSVIVQEEDTVASIGVALDATNTTHSTSTCSKEDTIGTKAASAIAEYNAIVSLGYHYLQWTENGGGAGGFGTDFYGSGAFVIGGLVGECYA